MTKREYIDEYFKIHEEADKENMMGRLFDLANGDRITTGSLSLYLSNEWYGSKQILNLLSRASQSKDYFRYIKRTSSWDLHYYIGDMKTNYKKTLEFITEQENLPFEQTQKQILIQTGKIEWV